ncbi:MAG: DNA-binding protein WhiA [Clostridiaceae bacterium]|nr:DNA-binding protein WhiA [Clostridiaceae bacterium]
MDTSFSSSVKEQLGRISLTNAADLLAEAYGMLLFATVFGADGIRHVTEQPALIRRLPMLYTRVFSVMPDIRTPHPGGKTVISVTERADIDRIFSAFGLDAARLTPLRVNRAVLEEESTRAAFLRGAFLVSGSVAHPEKRYHLELVTPHFNLSRELVALLQDMDLEPKVTIRRANYVLYYKYSEKIENFLTTIGAPMYALQVMSVKVEKDVRNRVNRQVNCDSANISKSVAASGQQCEAIERLRSSGALEKLSGELRAAADARTAYPDLALTALAATFEPAISRATLNYRLQRLIQIDRETNGGSLE